MKEFNRFCDTEISVYSENDGGYDFEGSNELLGSVMCDIQPYDLDTDSNAYGLSDNKAYKLYCEKNDLIKSGRRVILGGIYYRIVRAEEWKLGMSAVIKEI